VSLERYLKDLTDTAKPLKHTELIRLSGLLPEELALVQATWEKVPSKRRLELITLMSEVAEDDATLDFTMVFKLALHDSEDGVRARTVAGLWECEDRWLIGVLIKLLQRDRAESVRAAAAQGLGNFAALAEDDKLLSKDRERIRQVLLETFKNSKESPAVRRRAVEAISPFSGETVRALVQEAYQSSDADLRRSALYAMGQNADPQWLAILLKETSSSDPAMRYEAATACGELGEEAVVPHLLPLLRDDDLEVRLAAIGALGAIGGSVVQKALTVCLRSPDESVREAAQEALDLAEANSNALNFNTHP
jgi:HEAT repeat protein